MIYLLLIKFSKSKQTSNVWFWSKERRFKISAEKQIRFRNLRFLVFLSQNKDIWFDFFPWDIIRVKRVINSVKIEVFWRLAHQERENFEFMSFVSISVEYQEKLWKRFSCDFYRSCPIVSSEEETVCLIQNLTVHTNLQINVIKAFLQLTRLSISCLTYLGTNSL